MLILTLNFGFPLSDNASGRLRVGNSIDISIYNIL